MNARTLAVGSIFAIAAITGWRILKGAGSASATANVQRIERVWAAAALSLVISFATDIDSGLGAAFGAAITLGLLGAPDKPAGALTGTINKLSGGKLLQTPSSSVPQGGASGGGGSSSPPVASCPSGYALLQGKCVPIMIN